MLHGLRNEWLNGYMGRMAKGAIGLDSLTVNVRVSYLHDRGTNDKRATQETKRHPERTMRPLVGAAT
jgi:hypothetical protein